MHFATYLTFTFLKISPLSNGLVIGFYTTFYIFNNVEALLLFLYMVSYVELSDKTQKILVISNFIVFFIFIALDILNVFTGIFFGAENGRYFRQNTMILSQGYQFMTFAITVFVTVTHKKLNVREKTAFALYCILPLVAIIFQNVFKGYAIAYASIVVAAEILFFFISVQKNIELAEQQERNKETRIRLMISQIQPHFMYNSLSAISTLITIDPPRAQASLDDFTEYLRHNLSSLTEEGLIPFEKELKHIKTYISIEKMRSNERVNVIYNVSTTDFYVPPLSIQPIVENAVKHGILQKIEGGTVSIDAYETARAFVVEIKDDGVGFDISAVNFDDNEHFGLNNIRFRIAKMCGGKLDVKSEKGKGTVVTVTFMK